MASSDPRTDVAQYPLTHWIICGVFTLYFWKFEHANSDQILKRKRFSSETTAQMSFLSTTLTTPTQFPVTIFSLVQIQRNYESFSKLKYCILHSIAQHVISSINRWSLFEPSPEQIHNVGMRKSKNAESSPVVCSLFACVKTLQIRLSVFRQSL